MTTLQTLRLVDCPAISNAGIAYLANLSGLEELDLRGTNVTGDCVVSLHRMTKLQKLILSPDTVLTGRQLALLAPLGSLETILFRLPIEDLAAFAVLSKMTNLKILNLDSTAMTNRKMEFLRPLINLTVLNLGNAGLVSDRGIACLKEMKQLETLIIHGYGGGARGLQALASLKGLKTVDLRGLSFGDAGLGFLREMPSIERLRLDDTGVTDAGLSVVRGLGTLIELRLRNTAVSDRGLDSVSSLKELETLDLSFTKVGDAGMPRLKDLAELRSLNLNRTAVTGRTLNDLANCTKLRALKLHATKVDDAGLAEAAKLTSLLSLDLGGTTVTSVGLGKLSALRVLEEIDLRNCPSLSDEVVPILKGFRALKHVDFRETAISKAAIDELRKSGIQVDTASK